MKKLFKTCLIFLLVILMAFSAVGCKTERTVDLGNLGGPTQDNNGDNTGDGGNTSGGNTSGGNTSGGNASGGNTSGGNTSGGGSSDGGSTGGNTSGGNTSGGGTTGGGSTGGNDMTVIPDSNISIPENSELGRMIRSIDFNAGQDYSGKVSIKVVNNESEKIIINKIVEAFNEFYPNIKVTLDNSSLMDAYYGAISREYANNELEDIFWLAQDNVDAICSIVEEYEGNGYMPAMMLPLSAIDALDDSVDFKASFVPEAYNSSTFKNELFMMPRDYNQVVMYYNKTMFDVAGVAYPGKTPMTQSQFVTMLLNLRRGFQNAPNDKVMASGMKYNSYFNAANRPLVEVNLLWDSFAWPFLKSFGGQILNGDDNVVINSEANKKALAFLNNLNSRKLYKTSGNPDVQYLLQDCPILFHSRAVLTTILDEFEGRKITNLGVAPLPNFGGTYAVGGGSSGYAFNPQAKDKTAAWLFMKFVVDYAGQDAFCQTGNGVPVLKDMLYDETAVWRTVELDGLASDFDHDAFIYGLDFTENRPFASTRDFFQYVNVQNQQDFLNELQVLLNKLNVTQDENVLYQALSLASANMKNFCRQKPKI